MTLDFHAFPQIPTTRSDAVAQDDWVATEKVHGAQLVLAASASEVCIGKRKAWLAPDEPFFGWQMLRPLLQHAARVIHDALGGTGEVRIYGELFGGRYPHPGVSAVAGLVPVQTGIWYAPGLQYAVFDIVWARVEHGPTFLGHDQVQALVARGGLISPPVLGRGRFADVVRLPVRYSSRVPKALGLPELPSNDAEGYVLKPCAEFGVASRPCVKHKIPEFDEQQFDESRAFDADVFLSTEELLALASQLMNPARLASARSKVGTDRERIIEEAALDALVDLRDMFPRRIEALNSGEEDRILAHLQECARRSASDVALG